MVIDAEIQITIVEATVSALRLDDEKGGRLPTSPVAACPLAGLERGEQSPGQCAARRLEGSEHGGDRLFTDQDISLDRRILQRQAAAPVEAFVAAERRRPTLHVH